MGEFSMIAEGDRVLVGLSGGKDSLVLLHTLSEFRRRSPARFDLAACTVALRGMDVSDLRAYCAAREVPYIVLQHPILEIIESRKERSPCSFCANMRRGILNSRAREDGYNRLALGHNLDDAVETFFMNLFRAGRARSFQPKLYQTRTGVTVIRPLIYVRETVVVAEAHRLNLPILSTTCPWAGRTERQRTKNMLDTLSGELPNLFGNVVNALRSLDTADRWEAHEGEDQTGFQRVGDPLAESEAEPRPQVFDNRPNEEGEK
jgi:tRNA(Ile)-lysidine synthase TilS/MesJ